MGDLGTKMRRKMMKETGAVFVLFCFVPETAQLCVSQLTQFACAVLEGKGREGTH